VFLLIMRSYNEPTSNSHSSKSISSNEKRLVSPCSPSNSASYHIDFVAYSPKGPILFYGMSEVQFLKDTDTC